MLRGSTVKRLFNYGSQVDVRLSSSLTSLEESFPGTPTARPSSLPEPVLKSSILPNGVKVVSLDNGDKAVSLGMVLNFGSRDESFSEFGSTLVLQRMAFKSTSERSSIRLNRDLENAGIITTCNGGREQILYTAEGLPGTEKVAIEALTETITSPLFNPWEVEEVKKRIVEGVDLDEYKRSPSAMLFQAIHAAAFDSASPLGHSYYSNCELPNDSYGNLFSSRIGSDRITLAAIGVPHKSLLEEAENLLGNIASTSKSEVAVTSPFVGGQQKIHTSSGADTYIALAFEGITAGSKDVAVFSVLESLIDIVAKSAHPTLTTLEKTYSDTGFFAITGVDKPQKSGILVENMVKVMSEIAAHSVSSEQLNAAISAAKIRNCSAWMSNRMKLSTLVFGANQGTGITSEALSKISADDIKRVVSKMMEGKVALAAVGDMHSVPSHDNVRNLI